MDTRLRDGQGKEGGGKRVYYSEISSDTAARIGEKMKKSFFL